MVRRNVIFLIGYTPLRSCLPTFFAVHRMTTRIAARFVVWAVVVGALAAAGSPARAQSVGTLIPIPYTTYIGINPMGIPFDIGSVEVESGVAQGITLGGLASITAVDNDRYVSFDFKARYYPSEVVLHGFSLGLSVGSLRYSTIGGDSAKRQILTAPTIGVLTDYNWMLGTSRRFLVGTGLGAKRILATRSDRDRVNINQAYLTARFVVGLAF